MNCNILCIAKRGKKYINTEIMIIFLHILIKIYKINLSSKYYKSITTKSQYTVGTNSFSLYMLGILLGIAYD